MQFKREKWELRQMQAMPLRLKIQMTAQRIESWYEYWDSYNIRWEDDGPPGVYLSFSGGKDSTVLRHILKNHCIAVYDCPVVFVDTGLEYPEVRNFAIQNADVVLRPKMNFRQVILKYGYADLPTTGNKKGDVWNIVNADAAHGVNAGDNVAWNGTTWDVLAGTMDLSAYMLAEDLVAISNTELDNICK